MAKSKKSSKKDYTYASGRRKSSSARVRLFKGNKESTVNDIVIGKYFPGEVLRKLWQKPFGLTQTSGKYYITVKVIGGGKKGQLDAVIHATAKAFSTLDPKKYRTVLKSEGLLKRDARVRERRMIGTGGKSRHQKQSPKR
jgi:small subunit ribosomal protein S9